MDIVYERYLKRGKSFFVANDISMGSEETEDKRGRLDTKTQNRAWERVNGKRRNEKDQDQGTFKKGI